MAGGEVDDVDYLLRVAISYGEECEMIALETAILFRSDEC
jgi:hypothetical protein